MGIEIDVTANAKGFVQSAGQAASSLLDIADALDFIAKNADLSDEQLQQLFANTAAKARDAGAEAAQGYNRGTVAINDFGRALGQANRELAQTDAELQAARRLPAALDDSLRTTGRTAQTTATQLGRTGQSAEEFGEKTEHAGKLSTGVMYNLGFSALSAESLVSGGFKGMAENVGTFAAFLGPSLLGAEGAIAGLAWPVTIAGVAIAALAGLFSDTSDNAGDAEKAISDFITAFQEGNAGVDAFDKGLRDWAKDATDFGGAPLTEVSEAAKTAGASFEGIARSIISKSVPAMKQQQQALQLLEKQYNAAAATSDSGKQVKADTEKAAAIGKLSKALETQIANQKAAYEAEKVAANQMGLTVAQYKAYEAAVKEAQTDQDNFNNAVKSGAQQASTATGDWADSQKVDFAQMQTNQAEFLAAYSKFPATIKQLTEEGLSGAGKEFAESTLSPQQIEQLLSVPAAQRAQIIGQWNQLGKDTKKGLNDGISAGELAPVTIKTKADTSEAEADVKKFAAVKRDTTVDAKADTKAASKDLEAVEKKKRTATITAVADTSQAERDLSRLTRTRHMTVIVDQRVGNRV